jgi:hypothetical protein
VKGGGDPKKKSMNGKKGGPNPNKLADHGWGWRPLTSGGAAVFLFKGVGVGVHNRSATKIISSPPLLFESARLQRRVEQEKRPVIHYSAVCPWGKVHKENKLA